MTIDDLFGLCLDRFVPERNALARALRGQGEREQAAEVAALRKPSVAAWAVNQLVRTQHRPVAELFDSGDALREAHQQVVSGHGDGRALAAAVRRERAAVEQLLAAARGLLDSGGDELTPATIERVSDTLHAAALDSDSRVLVRDGRLQHELRHVGLGEGLEVGAAPTPGRAGRKTSAVGKRADREEAKARRAAKAQARRKLERAERALRTAQERRDRAAEALREAEEELVSAQSEAEAAARALG